MRLYTKIISMVLDNYSKKHYTVYPINGPSAKYFAFYKYMINEFKETNELHPKHGIGKATALNVSPIHLKQLLLYLFTVRKIMQE